MVATQPRPAATVDTTRVPVGPVGSMAAPADIMPARRVDSTVVEAVDSMVAVEADSTVEVAVVDPTVVVDAANQVLLISQRRPPGRR